ncbi:MAG: hypothetical protein SF051_00440 [Elusimicrobiota bacterium]|nr:hypothetical protein [Elusimicrobiota bacterium]
MRRLAFVVAVAAFAGGCFTWPDVSVRGLPQTEYYTDLGPESIDVSAYPESIRAHYPAFVRACGECHTLARSVNTPPQSRTYWRFHLARMSLHSRMRHAGPLSKEDREAVLDFLEYDDRVRKTEKREEFRRLDEELKRKFDPILEKQLLKLYQGG